MDITNNSHQNSDQPESPPPSCYLYAYTDESGAIMFACGWDEGVANIENFAGLLTQLTSGALNLEIIEHIGQHCFSQDRNDEMEFLMDCIAQLSDPEPDLGLNDDEIIVKPTEVKP